MSVPATRRLCVFATENVSRSRITVKTTLLRRSCPQLQRAPVLGFPRTYAKRAESEDKQPKRARRSSKKTETPSDDIAEATQELVEDTQASSIPHVGPSSEAPGSDPLIGFDSLPTVRAADPTEPPDGAVLVVEEEEQDEDSLGGIDLESGQALKVGEATGAEMNSASDPSSYPGSTSSTESPGVSDGRSSGGFWNIPRPAASDKEYLKENVTPLGHDELEQQREYREYARLAAWELPLLSKLAKPFVPPTANQPLRFRYTSYLGEEHPAATKVVLEFSPSDLPGLTDLQRDKLIKLLGVRYNPNTQTAKMSHESYPTQAQNKRYLLDRLNELLDEARHGKDTFKDIPFDFRHVKQKKWHEFPKEWIVTEERLRALLAARTQTQATEAEKRAEGGLIDGRSIVQRASQQPAMDAERVIVNRATGKPLRAPRRL